MYEDLSLYKGAWLVINKLRAIESYNLYLKA